MKNYGIETYLDKTFVCRQADPYVVLNRLSVFTHKLRQHVHQLQNIRLRLETGHLMWMVKKAQDFDYICSYLRKGEHFVGSILEDDGNLSQVGGALWEKASLAAVDSRSHLSFKLLAQALHVGLERSPKAVVSPPE